MIHSVVSLELRLRVNDIIAGNLKVEVTGTWRLCERERENFIHQSKYTIPVSQDSYIWQASRRDNRTHQAGCL